MGKLTYPSYVGYVASLAKPEGAAQAMVDARQRAPPPARLPRAAGGGGLAVSCATDDGVDNEHNR